MKTLLIMRHAKSSWDDINLSDFERPLIENGIKKTKKIIDFLQRERICIDLIVSSHALRAMETAKQIADGLNYEREKIEVNKFIYESDEEGLINEIYALPNDKNCVMIVGHNPTLSQFVNIFLNKKIDFLPTSAVVSISFDTDKWEKIESSKKTINFVAFPKKL